MKRLLLAAVLMSAAAHATFTAVFHIHSSESVAFDWEGKAVKCMCGRNPNHITIIDDTITATCDVCIFGNDKDYDDFE